MKRWFIIGLLCLCCLVCGAQKHKVGIVFSGGGALGLAHIGVIQALEEAGIRPTIVAGTSMGSLVGAMYASGLTAQQMHDVIKKYRFDKVGTIITPSVHAQSLGLANPKAIERVMREVMPENSFDSLKYPLYVCVSNLNSGKSEFHSKGNNLHRYLIASSAIPGLFEAVKIDNNYYVDGGLLNNFPAQAIRDKCVILIGVDANPRHANVSIESTKDVAMRSITVLVQDNSIPGRKMCDFLIESPANAMFKVLDFEQFETIYTYGYEAGKKYLARHPELVKKCATK